MTSSIEREYYILNKQVYTNKQGKKSCKITFFDPHHYVEGQNEKMFKGFVTRDEYCHIDYYHQVKFGYHKFVFEIPDYGHEFKLVSISPVQSQTKAS